MNQLLKLNLGCGFKRLPGCVNVDSEPKCCPDQVVNLEQFPWPWPDNTVSEVHLVHVLEHLGREPQVYMGIMKELWRVCVPQAAIYITVPHHRHDNFHADPTHVRVVTPLGLSLFDKVQCERWIEEGYSNTPLAIYCGVDFEIVDIRYDFERAWLDRLESGAISEEQLWDAVQHQCNVVTQLRVVLRTRQ